jgi:hypothetical protein
MMICEHPNLKTLNADDRSNNRAQLIALLDQTFPGYPADEIERVLDSDTFAFAHCDDCDEFLVRLA